MKASPLLRAWLSRLATQGVEVRTNTAWTGFDEAGEHSATLLALGGASWPKLGSDGAWTETLRAHGVELTPLAPANVGFRIAWSEHFRTRFAGQPLKGVAIRRSSHLARGDAMITDYGIEGGPIYALSAAIRDAIPTTIRIDLRPDLRHKEVEEKLARAKSGDSLSSTLRKTLGLSPVAVGLMHENGPPPHDPPGLAARIKAINLDVTAPHGIERAISTAGGVAWRAVDDTLQLRAVPGVYVAGEMLDWEAPTGGYLLQACFATGAWAARAILQR